MWTTKIFVFLVILAFQARAMNDDITHNNILLHAEPHGNDTKLAVMIEDIMVKFSTLEILPHHTVFFVLFFLLVFVIQSQASAIKRISELEKENVSLKETATMNRKQVTATNKRIKEDILTAVADVQKSTAELMEKKTKHSNLLFEHSHGISGLERQIADLKERLSVLPVAAQWPTEVNRDGQDKWARCDNGQQTDATGTGIAPSYMEDVMRCKVNEMVHVMNDLSWRLDIVERKFFVREHDVDVVLRSLCHDVTSLHSQAKFYSPKVRRETYV